MTTLERYTKFLAGLKLKHFSPVEITRYADRTTGRGVKNELPPQELWGNLVPTIRVLDELRAAIGKPIVLTSIYRGPAYNKAVGGVSGSQHLRNAAIDFQVRGMSPRAVYNRLLEMRRAGKFKGGLGLYSTFVHIDTRGVNATWRG